MKIEVTRLIGDAIVCIYNKEDALLHTEEFSGKFTMSDEPYYRSIPIEAEDYSHATTLFSGEFEYRVVV